MANNSWENCPTEVLCEIFSKIEDLELLICLQVCTKWKAAAYYIITKKYGGLEKVVKKGIEDIGMLYKNKSCLNVYDSYLNSLIWYNVRNSAINFLGICGRRVKYMSTYRDCLIIVDDHGVSYFDMQENYIKHYFMMSCLTFDESDNMVVITFPHKQSNVLQIFSKVINQTDSFDEAVYSSRMITYRFVGESCYFMNDVGYVMCISLVDSGTHVNYKPIGRYYGATSLVVGMHVSYNNDIYIMLKKGVIMRCGTTCLGQLFKDYCFDTPSWSNFVPTMAMFEHGALIEATPNTNQTVIHYNHQGEFVSILCPRLKSACDHGNVLFIGYNNGKVDIFIKRKLIKGNLIPERTIDVYDFNNESVYTKTREIRQIIVYEAIGSHILCIITDSLIVKLSVVNLELINSNEPIENVDEACFSIIHLLNIVV